MEVGEEGGGYAGKLKHVECDEHSPDLHEPRAPHVRLGTKPTTFVRCRIAEHPFLRRSGTQLDSDPQLVSLLGCEGPIKNSGFIFIYVCVCVWACLISRNCLSVCF